MTTYISGASHWTQEVIPPRMAAPRPIPGLGVSDGSVCELRRLLGHAGGDGRELIG